MTVKLNLKSLVVLAGMVLILVVGIVYALQVQRLVPGSFAVGNVQTAEETILLFREAPSSTADLTELRFGTGDVDAFGALLTGNTVAFWAANGGATPFRLTVEAIGVKLNGTPMSGDVMSLLMGPAGEALLASPDHATVIDTGDAPVALEAGLRFLETAADLGLSRGDTVTFTALFRADEVTQLVGWYFDTPVSGSPTDDVRVREAIDLAIDEAGIRSDFSFLPNWPSLDGAVQSRDLQRAEQLMADAGYPDGFVNMCINAGGSLNIGIANLMASDLAAIDINAAVNGSSCGNGRLVVAFIFR